MRTDRQVKREANRRFRQCVLNGLVDEHLAQEAADRIVEAGRRDARALLAQFLRLVRLDRARRAASIESAVPLGPKLQSTLEASLTRRFGPGLMTSFAHRPELIGGLRIQVGCDVYDDSVLARLQALEKSF
jgi:F-type H+-transporting ATPase subunit delta